ncbi:MAG: efflux RND transporter periplasmic adaptor subunit [Chloroflexi bacterium]|nr:efflux RND transporter periplasmic adaptor subunit [Chloroflexota bacterium]
MKRSQVAVLVIAGLLSVAVGYVGYGSRAASSAKAATTRLQTVEVQRGNLVATVNTTGSVVPATQAKLSFKSAGRLKELNVKVGDAVKQGQVLASLDTSDLEISLAQAQSSLNLSKLKVQQLTTPPKAEEVAAAQATYDSAVAKYNQLLAGPSQDDLTVAKAAVEKARIALLSAQTAYDRVGWRGDIGSRPEATTLEQATIDYESALAAYNQKTAASTPDQIKAAEASVHNAKKALNDKMQGAAEIDIAIAQEQVKQSQASLAQAQLNLDNAKLKAPFDGMVLSLGGNPGEQVGSGAALVVLVDPASVRIDASVDEMDVPKILSGQSVAYTLDALPNARLTGKVATVAPSATIQQGVSTYPVSLSLDPSSVSALKGGMSVGVSVVVEQKNNVLVVPNRAVRTTGRNRWVEVLVDGKPEQRQVRVGMSNDQSTEIAGGLEEGELVVIPTTTTSQPRVGGMGGFGGPPGGMGGGVIIRGGR